jgi:subfamily B ATP-binding cassette protein MsbA
LDAANRAHVTPFVEQLPDGFETVVGEKGGRLSGGQRQRIALARAIIRDPAILILDEATSAIDAQSEHLIHQTLKEFVKGRTTFLITHSVSQSILGFVTRIVVMDQGRMIAAGPHEEVLRVCPAYRRLYKAQIEQQSASGDGADASNRLSEDESTAAQKAVRQHAAHLEPTGGPSTQPHPPKQTEGPRILPLRLANPDDSNPSDAVG